MSDPTGADPVDGYTVDQRMGGLRGGEVTIAGDCIPEWDAPTGADDPPGLIGHPQDTDGMVLLLEQASAWMTQEDCENIAARLRELEAELSATRPIGKRLNRENADLKLSNQAALRTIKENLTAWERDVEVASRRIAELTELGNAMDEAADTHLHSPTEETWNTLHVAIERWKNK